MSLSKLPKLTGLERVFTLELPLREKVNKRNSEAINLNIYRNQHHYKRNNQKKAFHDRMKKPLSQLPKLGKVWLHYEIFPKTRRRLDTMNPGSVIDKFFSDCLVDEKILPDDNYEYVVFNSFSVGGVDKENPRCMVTITELTDQTNQKEDEMKLSMTANLSTMDIQEAIAAWVSEETGQEALATNVTLTPEGAVVTVGEAPATKPKTKRRTKVQMEADVKGTSDDTMAEIGTSSTSGDDTGTGEPTEAGSTEAESQDKPTTKTEGEGRGSKNLFGDSPEGSSNDGGEEAKAPAPNEVKKGSIFDT